MKYPRLILKMEKPSPEDMEELRRALEKQNKYERVPILTHNITPIWQPVGRRRIPHKPSMVAHRVRGYRQCAYLRPSCPWAKA